MSENSLLPDQQNVNDPSAAEENAEFRDYLMTVAQLHLEPALRQKFDASDVVQQTLLEAHQQAENFRGNTRAEKAGWLKQMLLHNLIDMMRAFRREKRDVGREQAMQASIDQSTARLSACLIAQQQSPQSRAIQDEQGLRLAEALATLPQPQREALVLQHFHGWSVAQIAEHMGRSRTAVAGLLKRGLQKLRQQIREA